MSEQTTVLLLWFAVYNTLVAGQSLQNYFFLKQKKRSHTFINMDNFFDDPNIGERKPPQPIQGLRRDPETQNLRSTIMPTMCSCI